jgi:hypothetical protein
MKAHKPPDINEKSVQATGLFGHFSRADVRYWQPRVFRQSYTREGQMRLTKDWAMKIAHQGRRETFPLGTPNKAAAAASARYIYLHLLAHGWESTLAKYKPKVVAPNTAADEGQPVTVARFLEEVLRATTNRRTVEGYAKAFRQIVSDLFGFSDSPEKYDYRGGGWVKWLANVHGIQLAAL